MPEKREKLSKLFDYIIPKLSDWEVEKLICLGEGMAFKINQIENENKETKSV